jgi:PAS domain S-box-containing protein
VSVAVLFTLFTMMCGLTHLFTAFLHFNSLSAPGAVVGSKVATAIVSVATAIVMYLIMPMILEMLRLVEIIRKGRLQEMSRLMRLVTEHCTEVIATHSVDQHLRFLSANGASESCFGRSPDELIGQSFFSVIHEDDAEQVKSVLEDVMHRALQTTVTDLTATRMEYRVKNLRDGEPKWMESSVSIAYEDMQPLLIIITRDITTRRFVEQRRFQETESERDAAVVNAKLHFLACAAHDLKTYVCFPACLLAAMIAFCVRVCDISPSIRLFFPVSPLAAARSRLSGWRSTNYNRQSSHTRRRRTSRRRSCAWTL